jgi:hypothetical protein
MSGEAQNNRFRRLPGRPEPGDVTAGRVEGPLQEAIAEPVEVGDTTVPVRVRANR